MPALLPENDVALARAGTVAGSAELVLAPTRRGREELERPRVRLGRHPRRLLTQLDGRRSLAQCVDADPRLLPERLPRDAARLVAFGLARQVCGELPSTLLLEAMNLTARITLDRLPPLEPERTVMPMLPRVAPPPARSAPSVEAHASASRSPRWPVAILAALLAAAVAAIGYLS